MREPIFPASLPDHVRFDDLAAGGACGAATNGPDAADPPLEIDFTPVPRLRRRRSGWTDERQREFIRALARCGSVAAAARHVSLTPRGAYRLLMAPGADSFAAAWDAAADIGLMQLRCDSLERSLGGSFVPIYRRGKLVRVEHRHNDALAIAMLGGRDNQVDHYARHAASRRRKLAQDFAALDASRAEQVRAAEELATAYRLELEAMIERGAAREAERRALRRPRIRAL